MINQYSCTNNLYNRCCIILIRHRMEVTVIMKYMNSGWQDLHGLVLGDGDLHNPVCPRQRRHGRLEPIYYTHI